ncbi:PASTA domain-containing protein [Treponema endosymbiont of Eucomonympha sp.]|uniref:PASTA domain-containing protein n=1 Tax=Treponema endosymbiont of Eucomonympha sp. TaxID=1580831 RepID=UPI000A9E3229|nr:PASTA domain-containing protein [Treponema endosymbiont of Eucomonympha sp.]
MEKPEARPLTGKTLCLVIAAAFAAMLLTATAVFFLALDRSNTVQVPDIAGKELAEALLDLQAKELFPKIELRYSESAEDKGTVLSQKPSAGAEVKAGRRISLAVSRGALMNQIEDFAGRQLDEARLSLQTLFSGAVRPLVTLADPLYAASGRPAGTIIAQDPPAGTPVSGPVTLTLVVSKGNKTEPVVPPSLVGMSIEKALSALAKAPVIFDFTSRPAERGKAPGTVVSQEPAGGEPVDRYSRIAAEIALPDGAAGGTVYGLLTAQAPEYPYPVPLRLLARGEEGDSVLAAFDHTGGYVSVPYAAAPGTELVLTLAGRELARLSLPVTRALL